jgi:hypothetical protein
VVTARFLIDHSPLDPFSTLGLAGNIIQFVDFRSKLVAGTVEVYQSAQSTSANHLHLENITTSLSELCTGLGSARSARQPNTASSTPPEHTFNTLAENCHKDVKELLDVLEELKVKGGNRKWGSFRQALKGVWKDGKILRQEKRLSGYRSELVIQLTALPW